MSLRRLHVYGARDSAFGADDVLQENVILQAVRTDQRRPVLVTTSSGADDHLLGVREVPYAHLRQLPYPTRGQLKALGAAAGEAMLSQAKIDDLVAAHVEELSDHDGGGPLALHQKVTEAQEVLRKLGLPKAQTNERSALTLLALLHLTPGTGWANITRPMMGITPMMDFMAEHYGKRYAPNSRETVRRQTVHQFVAAGIAVINPDDPARPTNSGLTVYQVPDELDAALRSFGTPGWDARLTEWHQAAPALIERWARIRQMNMVPVTLPNGGLVELSAGGQNPLIKAVVEEFCPRRATCRPDSEVMR